MAAYDNPEFELQKQQLNRQQKMAEMLLAQGQQMAQGPAGQMVSGQYVANSPLQMLNAPINQIVGAYLAKSGDEKATKLAQALREKESELLNKYMDSMTPTEKITELAGPYGATSTGQTVPMPIAVEQKGPDFKSAFAAAMDPYAPAYLKAQAIDMLKTQKVGEGETLGRFNLSTGKFEPFAEGGMKLAPDVKAAAQFLGITKPMNQWTEQELGAVNQKAAEMKKLTGTVVNIPNFAEKTFAGGLAEDQVKKFSTLQTNAEKAPDVLNNVAESKKILKSGKFFSGSPANVQLEMAKMADAFGLGGADTKTKAANTQTLITNAAGSTLDSIAGSGLGAGQGFTDKDLKFLQEAKSFRIDMTDTNIKRILDLQERAAKASVNRYNDRLRTLPQASIQTMGLTPIVLPRTADEIVGGK